MPIPACRVFPPLLAALLVFLGAAPLSVNAQDGGQVNLAPFDTSGFPKLTTFLDVRDVDGDFVYGLTIDDVSVEEDGRALPASELIQVRPGVQLVTAINPGPSFTIRDVQGFSRYDYILKALQAWGASRLGTTLDDLSFLGSGSPEATHMSDGTNWLAALNAYQLEESQTIPGFDVLARALEVAADPTPRAGMGRAVLFVTSLPEQDVSIGLQNLAARAGALSVKIFVWLIASAEQFDSPEAAQLADLAAQTGGALFAFSAQEPIPDLEEYLEPLRATYFLAYESQFTTSGLHQVRVHLQTETFEVYSPVLEFGLDVLPPNIAFVSPPPEIQRSFPEEAQGEVESLLPDKQTLEVLIEFPDGHERSLQRTTLYVDGVVVDTNSSPPFEQFSWDLTAYTSTGEHKLKAEAIDSLGLSGASMDTPVVISVQRSSLNVLNTVYRNRPLVVGTVVLIAGAVLALVLILGGRVHPGSFRRMRRSRQRTDPVTQPVPVKAEPPPQRQTRWRKRPHWPQRRYAPQAYAFLVHISESNQADSSPPIPITAERVTFGRDVVQSSQVVDDPSVEPLHACLQREEDGSFRLADEGSTAGTWVNYTPISQEGIRLEHGDLIHIGRIGFRFQLREPKRVRKPVVSPLVRFP